MNLLTLCIRNDNQNELKNDKGKHAYINFFTYMKIFQMFGIDISFLNNNPTKSIVASVAKNLMHSIFITLFLNVVSQAYYVIKYKENIKLLLVNVITFLESYLTWYYIIRYQPQLIKKIEKLQKMEKLFKVSLPPNLIIICYLLHTSTCIVRLCLYPYEYDVNKSKYLVLMLTFDKADIHEVHWSIITLISWHIYQLAITFVLFFMWFFSSFYIIVCCYMKIILSRHVQINKRILKLHFITSKHCDGCFFVTIRF